MQGNTLAALKKGQKARIEAVDSSDPQVQRLMTLGLVEGAEVELASSALGGDPLEYRLFGRGISLRQEQARHFRVVTIEQAETQSQTQLLDVAAAASGG